MIEIVERNGEYEVHLYILENSYRLIGIYKTLAEAEDIVRRMRD